MLRLLKKHEMLHEQLLHKSRVDAHTFLTSLMSESGMRIFFGDAFFVLSKQIKLKNTLTHVCTCTCNYNNEHNGNIYCSDNLLA